MHNTYIIGECNRLGISPNLIDTHFSETYSQTGEDTIIEALLFALAAKTPPMKTLFYVDIGANHPIQTSNTYLLYKKYNGQGLLVEADPELIPLLRQVRPRDQVIHAAVTDHREPTVLFNVARAKELSSLHSQHVKGFAHWGDVANIVAHVEVPNLHVDDLLARYAPEPIHYLSIDVEGGDLAIIRALNFERFRPRLVSCEPSPDLIPANPQQMLQVMSSNGYSFIGRTAVNMIFIDKRWL
jgi:FkbM family methyltransferase